MGKVHKGTVNFSVEGGFITEHFRSLVSEGEWRKAFEGLKDSLVGITTDQVYSVLSGHSKLEGVNHIDMVEDTAYQNNEWVKEQYYPYTRDICLIDGKLYQHYNTVEALNQDDVQGALDDICLKSVPANGSASVPLVFNMHRALQYADNKFNDLALIIGEDWYLFKPVENEPSYPAWLSRKDYENLIEPLSKLVQQAKEELDDHEEYANSHFDEVRAAEATKALTGAKSGLDEYMQQTMEADSALADIDGLKQRIAEQADKKGGWLELVDKKTGKQYRIPKNAFLRWCLNDNPMYDTIDWSAISPRTLKSAGDDPNHTDWWLFTGEELTQAQNDDVPAVRFFFNQRHKWHEKMTGSNIKPLLRGSHKGFDKAYVRHVDTPDKIDFINENDVIVIPNASPDFEAVAHRCAEKGSILITETGGKLCHLATIGREFGLTLYLLPDAMKLLPVGSQVKLNVKEDDIKLLDASGEAFERLMVRKVSGAHYL